MSWWKRRKPKKWEIEVSEETFNLAKEMFDGKTLEELVEINQAFATYFREEHAELLEEINQYPYGSPEHRDITYRLYTMGLHIENDRRMQANQTMNFVLSQKEFEKLYYGSDS